MLPIVWIIDKVGEISIKIFAAIIIMTWVILTFIAAMAIIIIPIVVTWLVLVPTLSKFLEY